MNEQEGWFTKRYSFRSSDEMYTTMT